MNAQREGDALALVAQSLSSRSVASRKFSYRIPSLWSSADSAPQQIRVNPFQFYLSAVKEIQRMSIPRSPGTIGGEWTKDAVIYNMFVRTTTAFDHNGNGRLDLPVNEDGFREAGSFLKAMAMLPYVRRLGVNTVHLLPITSIGHDGNKGTLGSPYAIRNPYELDENLGEPALGLDVKVQFKAFVEAAHRLGLRVVVEFVFRTAAKDGDWVKEHPEWMYWIRDDIQVRQPGETDEGKYGSPLFSREELERIHQDVSAHRFGNLLPPHTRYRDFFTVPPPAGHVGKEDGRYVGRLQDGTRVKVPGAFADWPPDDNQPPWGDVTYLRLYTHPDFNYIGYNTIRMYDDRLAQSQFINKPLWEKIVGIIPYYQREFHIDGVMIDMGHALPMKLKSEMVNTARSIDPDFAFWDENFSITHRSREEGYNAVFGYCWTDEHHAAKMKAFCRRLATEGVPIPFFATPESHNTPRAAARPGGTAYARWAMVINSFLPGIPFIHSGYELGERYPINTGLDFSREDLKNLPSEKLPLFSEYAYDWLNREQFTGLIRSVLAIREKYSSIITDADPQTFRLLEDPNEHILAFARISQTDRTGLAVIANASFSSTESARLRLDTTHQQVEERLSGKKFTITDGQFHAALSPGQCLIVEL